MRSRCFWLVLVLVLAVALPHASEDLPGTARKHLRVAILPAPIVERRASQPADAEATRRAESPPLHIHRDRLSLLSTLTI